MTTRRKKIPTLEQQLAYLNAPRARLVKTTLVSRIFGCEIHSDGAAFVVRKAGQDVGTASTVREAQDVARANW